jgi:hypothetical protein
MSWMDRVIGQQNYSVVSYVNSQLPSDEHVQMIPYIFTANNTYRLFNDQLRYNQDTPDAATFDDLTSQGGPIPDHDQLATMSAGTVLDNALADLIAAFNAGFDEGFNNLMKFDGISLRTYLLQKGFTSQDIDWMETIDDATTHFDSYSLSQAVLEQWFFNSAPLDSWTAVEGGMDRITVGMTRTLAKKPIMNKWVKSLVGNSDQSVTTVTSDDEERTYSHVINTVPLGVMQNMDLSTLDLDYNKTFAIRKLQYDPAGKIGMSFRSRWYVFPTHSVTMTNLRTGGRTILLAVNLTPTSPSAVASIPLTASTPLTPQPP